MTTSHRIAQIESTLKRVVSDVLSRGLSDPRVMGMISVTRVTVSPDLHQAWVYVSVLPAKYEKRTLAGLLSATRHVQAEVAEQMATRIMPHLEFRLDESLKRQAAVDEALRRAAARTTTTEEESKT